MLPAPSSVERIFWDRNDSELWLVGGIAEEHPQLEVYDAAAGSFSISIRLLLDDVDTVAGILVRRVLGARAAPRPLLYRGRQSAAELSMCQAGGLSLHHDDQGRPRSACLSS